MLSIGRRMDVFFKERILYDHHIKSSKMYTFQMLVEMFYNVSIRLSGVMSRNVLAGFLFIVVGFFLLS